MMRVPIWATAFALVAGGSLAAPSLDVPMRAPRLEQPTLSEDSSLEAPAWAVEEEVTAGAVQIAGKRRGGGGRRGGAKRRNRGGFRSGNSRNALRGGEPGRPGRVGDPGGLRGGEPGRVGDPGGLRGGRVDRNVNVRGGNVNVRGGNVYGGGDWDDDDDELEAALIGGVVGLGIGSLINSSE
jgi:hypothetical protein